MPCDARQGERPDAATLPNPPALNDEGGREAGDVIPHVGLCHVTHGPADDCSDLSFVIQILTILRTNQRAAMDVQRRGRFLEIGVSPSALSTLFRAKPFAAVTTQEMAQTARIGAGTLFLYASSKEDLLVLVFKDEMLDVARRTFAKVGRTLPIVEQPMVCFMAYHARDLALSRVLLKELTILSNAERRLDCGADACDPWRHWRAPWSGASAARRLVPAGGPHLSRGVVCRLLPRPDGMVERRDDKSRI